MYQRIDGLTGCAPNKFFETPVRQMIGVFLFYVYSYPLGISITLSSLSARHNGWSQCSISSVVASIEVEIVGYQYDSCGGVISRSVIDDKEIFSGYRKIRKIFSEHMYQLK